MLWTLVPVSAHADGGRGELFENPYTSTAVEKDDALHPLFTGVEVALRFGRGEREAGISLVAQCNRIWAPIEITPESLQVGEIWGTAAGCSDRLHAQDEWLVRFFRSDPHWRAEGGRLRLWSKSRVIRLRRSD